MHKLRWRPDMTVKLEPHHDEGFLKSHVVGRKKEKKRTPSGVIITGLTGEAAPTSP